MARHQIGKKVSKATRISCHGNKRVSAIMANAGATRVGTAMHEAFLNIKVAVMDDYSGPRDVIESVLTAAKRNAGNNLIGRGWSANLSAKTVRQLTQDGVFA